MNNGVETKYELLLGFSESLENKGLFSEMTGVYWFIKFEVKFVAWIKDIVH